MQLTFSQEVQCDSGRRIISGKIVPFGPVGMVLSFELVLFLPCDPGRDG